MTSTQPVPRRQHPVEAAIAFVAAQPGGALRLLRKHRRGSDGYCVGCVAVPTKWPCTAARIATAADRPAN